MASSVAGLRQLTIVSGGKNHMRDYVTTILLEDQLAPGEPPPPIRLKARLKAISKAIGVAEVARRQAAERNLAARSSVEMKGLREDGPQRREMPEIEITLHFERKPEADAVSS
eukprot:TRINITY_DN31510_c0_g1_i1.p1 TRINITY_DN31510_c0_g1~~TRINITY_DN31510_c0_g1_i1.p1  ORF type:complete len:113 (-),score=28.24 TRINITY_DN31510_c0_g1_i1:319-657(-)